MGASQSYRRRPNDPGRNFWPPNAANQANVSLPPSADSPPREPPHQHHTARIARTSSSFAAPMLPSCWCFAFPSSAQVSQPPGLCGFHPFGSHTLSPGGLQPSSSDCTTRFRRACLGFLLFQELGAGRNPSYGSFTLPGHQHSASELAVCHMLCLS